MTIHKTHVHKVARTSNGIAASLTLAELREFVEATKDLPGTLVPLIGDERISSMRVVEDAS